MNEYLLEKLWDGYISISDRRWKSLKHLIIVLLILIVVYYVPTNDLKFTLFGITSDISFNKFLALSLAPLLIIIFTTRFWYLFAHSVIKFVYYLQHYQKFYEKELSVLDYGFHKLYDLFKMRDITESMNIFLFPKVILNSPRNLKITKMNKKINLKVADTIHDLFAILLFIIPMFLYCWATYTIKIDGSILFTVYFYLGICKLIFFIFLIRETKDVRDYYKMENPKPPF